MLDFFYFVVWVIVDEPLYLFPCLSD